MSEITGFFAGLVDAGPIGFFFLAVITNATVFLPFPVLEVALVTAGSVSFWNLGFFSPLLLGIFAGCGASIGELSGYFVGSGGRHVLKRFKKEQVEKIVVYGKRLEQQGLLALVVFAFLPLPFDLAGVAAGLVHFPKRLFLVGCALGKSPRYALIAYAGYFGLPFVLKFFGLG
jgi:membrane protein YqaA with SNARE-associated domain